MESQRALEFGEILGPAGPVLDDSDPVGLPSVAHAVRVKRQLWGRGNDAEATTVLALQGVTINDAGSKGRAQHLRLPRDRAAKRMSPDGGVASPAFAGQKVEPPAKTWQDSFGRLVRQGRLPVRSRALAELRPSVRVTVLVLVVSLALSSPVSAGQNDQLDPSFGGDGKVTTEGPGFADVAVQRDGKIVAAGSYGWVSPEHGRLARYLPDGSLDPSFADDGLAEAPIDIAGIAIQPDGKIVTAGWVGTMYATDFALARFHPNGSLDRSFGEDGKVTTDFSGSPDLANALALQPDGKIIAAGYAQETHDRGQAVALARYNSNGSPDASFGADGKVAANAPSASGQARDVAVQSDGKIVTGGYSYHSPDVVLRFTQDGQLDTSFGTKGQLGAFNGRGSVHSIAIQADGRIVAGGDVYRKSDEPAVGDDADFGVARFLRDGTPDGSFGTGDPVFGGAGRVTADLGTRGDVAFDVAVHADGRIALAGYQPRENPEIGGGQQFALAQFNRDGSLDGGFGSRGTVTTDFSSDGASDAGAAAVTVQPDGKVVAAGGANTTVGGALARYLRSGAPDPPPADPPPQCQDARDNDADGKTDFPADPGCASASDDSEDPDPAPPNGTAPSPQPGPTSPGSGSPVSRDEIEDLALRYRPWLRFDSGERWRPLEIGMFRAEPGLEVCRRLRRHGRRDPCRRMSAFPDSAPYNRPEAYLRIPLRDQGLASPHAECLRGRLLDCDAGPRSSIYYSAYQHRRLLYLDYWWFLRNNDYYGPTFDHQGDWEGVTATVYRGRLRDVLLDVAFAGHLGGSRAWRYLALPLSHVDSSRVNVYIANGSHAAYPRPCTRRCEQTNGGNGDGVSIRPETRFNGEMSWGNNPTEACLAHDCLRALPKVTRVTEEPRARDWAAWQGRWGNSGGGSPQSPGRQGRFLRPWDTESTRRQELGAYQAGRAASRQPAPGCDESWFGPFVQAFACEEATLRGTYASHAFETPPSFEVSSSQPGARGGTAPGIGQVLGEPLEPGQQVTITGSAPPATDVLVRLADGTWTATAEVTKLGLERGGTTTIRATRISGKPAVLVRDPIRGLRRIRAKRAPLPRPQAVRAERHGRQVTVSFVTVPSVRAEVALSRNRRGSAVSSRTVKVRGRGPAHEVKVGLRSRPGARFARVRLLTRGHTSSLVAVPIRARR